MDNLLSLDIGNGYSVSYDGQKISTIQSVYKELLGGDEWLTGGGQMVYRKHRYHLGKSATKYPSPETVAEANKLDMAIPFALSLLPVHPNNFTFDLVLSMPDTGRYERILRKLLEGTHEYELNGRERQTAFRVIGTHPEAYGSYVMASERGQLTDEGYTLVIDIGAGTYVALVVDNSSGEILAKHTKEKRGVIDLANIIANDRRIVEQLGDAPNVDLILEGIVKGNYKYGTTKVNFESVYKEALRIWFRRICNEVLSHYDSYKSKLKGALVTGGGALLVKTALADKPFFVVAEHPLTDNCVGLYKHTVNHPYIADGK